MTERTVTLRLTGSAQGLIATVDAAKAKIREFGGAAEKAGSDAGAGMTKARRGLESISTQLRGLQNIGALWASFAGARAVAGDLARTADAMSGMNARLRLVTDSAASYALHHQSQRHVDRCGYRHRVARRAGCLPRVGVPGAFRHVNNTNSPTHPSD